jgi:hypothetical protein
MVDMGRQFSLRTIFVVIALLSMCGAIFALARNSEHVRFVLVYAIGAAVATLFILSLAWGPSLVVYCLLDLLPGLLSGFVSLFDSRPRSRRLTKLEKPNSPDDIVKQPPA